MDKKTILIVEDDRPLMQAMYEKLSRENYNLLKSFDGDDGLETALVKHPDLILLDIIMPKMSGLTMLKKLREDTWGREVPVIILTNLAEDIVSEELKKNIVGYFIKSDWKIEDIVRKIKELF